MSEKIIIIAEDIYGSHIIVDKSGDKICFDTIKTAKNYIKRKLKNLGYTQFSFYHWLKNG